MVKGKACSHQYPEVKTMKIIFFKELLPTLFLTLISTTEVKKKAIRGVNLGQKILWNI